MIEFYNDFLNSFLKYTIARNGASSSFLDDLIFCLFKNCVKALILVEIYLKEQLLSETIFKENTILRLRSYRDLFSRETQKPCPNLFSHIHMVGPS